MSKNLVSYRSENNFGLSK